MLTPERLHKSTAQVDEYVGMTAICNALHKSGLDGSVEEVPFAVCYKSCGRCRNQMRPTFNFLANIQRATCGVKTRNIRYPEHTVPIMKHIGGGIMLWEWLFSVKEGRRTNSQW